MSNDWDVYCVDCDEEMWGISYEANHAEKGVAILIKNRGLFERAALTVGDYLRIEHLTIDAPGLCGAQVKPEFFRKHKGHTLAPRSEYGYLLDDCAKAFSCDAGGRHSCARKKGHDGLCGIERDYTPGEAS